ncbi:MAG: polysaccharide deacetylase family protein [Candidatus Didemnitutus sp.]|nr:polysaccharide deacetylase family protein [Candidatus Didemnitutus sp.]
MSNTPGKFVVSFDCEGKWGMADHLTPALEARLTTAALDEIYRKLVTTLARHDIHATFAFVGMFTLSTEMLPRFLSRLPNVEFDGRPWLQAFHRAVRSDKLDGWLVPSALRRVQSDGRHELATHGFTHVPLAEKVVPADVFDLELSLVRELAASQGWSPRTIIFPRNQIGHVARLAGHGVVGYRELWRPDLRGMARRMGSLLLELGMGARAQKEAPGGLSESRPIPSGYLLNFWHNRSRRLISRARTVRRWKALLHDAAARGGVVHLWSHPHNFLTDPGLLPVFDAILSEAAILVAEGRLLNPTQVEYCVPPARP